MLRSDGCRDPAACRAVPLQTARGAAFITTENIGRPFAIVRDDRVLSASVICEPILGGSRQINGDFTIGQANTIAMLLRSGTLPGRLSLVKQQVVEPAQ